MNAGSNGPMTINSALHSALTGLVRCEELARSIRNHTGRSEAVGPGSDAKENFPDNTSDAANLICQRIATLGDTLEDLNNRF